MALGQSALNGKGSWIPAFAGMTLFFSPTLAIEPSVRGMISILMPSYVYILASQTAGTLYTGVTSDLVKRIAEHKSDAIKGFTAKYGVHDLVWYEVHGDIETAIQREKCIKEWRRAWKIRLIEKTNPDWRDLYSRIV